MTLIRLCGGAALALALAACGQEPAPPAPVAELPAAPPAAIAPVAVQDAGPDYWSEAEQVNDDYYDEPPAYAFDYDGYAPEVWGAGDGVRRVVEWLAGGQPRYYYYRDGEDYPYLVRDRDYAYGYQDGRLAALYDARGTRLPAAQLERRAPDAGRYLARARDLRQAAASQPRREVQAQTWTKQRAVIQPPPAAGRRPQVDVRQPPPRAEPPRPGPDRAVAEGQRRQVQAERGRDGAQQRAAREAETAQAKVKAEAEAKAKTDAQAKVQADAQAKVQADAQARAKARPPARTQPPAKVQPAPKPEEKARPAERQKAADKRKAREEQRQDRKDGRDDN